MYIVDVMIIGVLGAVALFEVESLLEFRFYACVN